MVFSSSVFLFLFFPLVLAGYYNQTINLSFFNGILETLIEKENPGIVIILHHCVYNNKHFDFR